MRTPLRYNLRSVGWLVNGVQMNLLMSGFRFLVTGRIVLMGLTLAAAIGLLGGLMPVRSAAQQQI